MAKYDLLIIFNQINTIIIMPKWRVQYFSGGQIKEVIVDQQNATCGTTVIDEAKRMVGWSNFDAIYKSEKL